ncbi:S-layer domain protein [Bacillus sp. OxB-1]|uniref:hypothetical protein n=1 Tax=Bacillus sp. (strain OxB-1) TaxID=98228 RepID=UPI0005823397|nr:hypothetical protein [Bacillus sp. OxB-1]BAQ11648.1 S-layer domain protein [Bacillus sp. OxB-1]
MGKMDIENADVVFCDVFHNCRNHIHNLDRICHIDHNQIAPLFFLLCIHLDYARYDWKSCTFAYNHNNVIIGNGFWADLTVMGFGIHDGYAHVWFGVEADPAGYME